MARRKLQLRSSLTTGQRCKQPPDWQGLCAAWPAGAGAAGSKKTQKTGTTLNRCKGVNQNYFLPSSSPVLRVQSRL